MSDESTLPLYVTHVVCQMSKVDFSESDKWLPKSIASKLTRIFK